MAAFPPRLPMPASTAEALAPFGPGPAASEERPAAESFEGEAEEAAEAAEDAGPLPCSRAACTSATSSNSRESGRIPAARSHGRSDWFEAMTRLITCEEREGLGRSVRCEREIEVGGRRR